MCVEFGMFRSFHLSSHVRCARIYSRLKLESLEYPGDLLNIKDMWPPNTENFRAKSQHFDCC